MIASLTMYARPELEAAHECLWRLSRDGLRDRGIGAPEHLSQDLQEAEIWRHPGLVLGQTCGMPFRTWLHDKVALIGTPDYGLKGLPAGMYRSAIVVRADDRRTGLGDFTSAVFAYNQRFSQSGFAAPYWHLRPHGFWFQNQLQTGAHLASARAVAENRADIAALDAVSWRLMQTHEPVSQALRVLDWTAATPGLPLIAAKGADVSTCFEAVQQAIDDLPTAYREALGLRDLVAIPKAAYMAVQNPPDWT